MAPNDSQTLDVVDIEDLILNLLPKISKTVRRIYRRPAYQGEIEDVIQDVILKLIEDDYCRLRSFGGRSNIETWLYTIVRHCVGQYLWKRRWEEKNVNLDDMASDALSYQPAMEKTLIDEELGKAVSLRQSSLDSLNARRRASYYL